MTEIGRRLVNSEHWESSYKLEVEHKEKLRKDVAEYLSKWIDAERKVNDLVDVDLKQRIEQLTELLRVANEGRAILTRDLKKVQEQRDDVQQSHQELISKYFEIIKRCKKYEEIIKLCKKKKCTTN